MNKEIVKAVKTIAEYCTTQDCIGCPLNYYGTKEFGCSEVALNGWDSERIIRALSKPKEGQHYYAVNINTALTREIWRDSEKDNNCLDAGLAFTTRVEADMAFNKCHKWVCEYVNKLKKEST